MQRIYMHSNEHFEVFTTVLAPQGRYRYRAEAEKVVAVHSYSPQWPDELALCPGDVILVLSKHEEGRWFGRLQNSQQGYFPASCVMEQGQDTLSPKGLQRSVSLRPSVGDSDVHLRSKHGSGYILQALRRASTGGGGAVALDGSQGGSDGPHMVWRPQIPEPQPVAPQSQVHRSSPGLLHRILSKRRRKSECQGATNGAFEGD